MGNVFTTTCFIRKDTPELREKLEELGYAIMYGYDTGFIITNPKFGVAFIPVGPKAKVDENDIGEYIDCGTNETLFLAIAALRDDSDYMQWFCDDHIDEFKYFFLCEYDNVGKHIHEKMDGWDCDGFHKATAAELINHFKS